MLRRDPHARPSIAVAGERLRLRVAVVVASLLVRAASSAAADASSAAAAGAARLRSARACPAGACAVAPAWAPVAGARARGDGRALALFVRLALAEKIGGFVNSPTYAAFAVVAAAQRAAGVWGSVGEIGVHHGRSFILASLLSRSDEPLFALDLFEELQSLNVDQSGSGSYEALAHNMARVGLNVSAVVVERRSSADLPPGYFCAPARLPRFRFFSVDGGHTEALTRLDMAAALCHLAEGGVIAVDDVFNNLFLGVTEGIFNAMTLNRDRLAPFLVVTGKIYFTTPSHHARYLRAAEEFFVARYASTAFSARDAHRLFWGWRVVAMAVPHHRVIQGTTERLADVLADLRAATGGYHGDIRE